MDLQPTPEATIQDQAKRLVFIQDAAKAVYDALATQLAIETLEYHDKNALSGDNESRSRQCQDRLYYAMRKMGEIKNASL